MPTTIRNRPPSGPPSIASWPREKLLATKRRLRWRALARTAQLAPDGEWRVWYVRGGRGSGKTRTGSSTLAEWIVAYPSQDWAVIAPTFGDARDVGIEGPSGLLKALGLSRSFKGWNRSYGELFLPDGGVVYCDGADDGALRIQGKNLSGAWCDEVGLWRQWRLAWEESIAFAVRIDPALIVATGTPKRGHQLVRRLMDDDTVAKTLLRTLDNAENLSRVALDELLRRYGGTTLGRQELEGAILDEVDGALWKREHIAYGEPPFSDKTGVMAPDYSRIVVAIDPAVSYGPDADETGVVVCAKGVDGHGYVLDDQSGQHSHQEWAKRAIRAYEHYEADVIVGEVNNGGDLVEANLRATGYSGNYRAVHASRGKRIRAEPIAGLYEQGRVKHRRPFPELEDQLCTFTSDSLMSPDRLDALVWGFTELMLAPEVSGTEFSAIA